MARINKSLQLNKELVLGYKYEGLLKEHEEMIKKRDLEDEAMAEFTNVGMHLLNEEENVQINKRQEQTNNLIDMVDNKLKLLDTNSPLYFLEYILTYRVTQNALDKWNNFQEEIVYNATKKSLLLDKDLGELTLAKFNIARNIRLKQREDFLESNKEFLNKINSCYEDVSKSINESLAESNKEQSSPKDPKEENIQSLTENQVESNKEQSNPKDPEEKSTQSLIADYADPNLEQPGYMDPED